MQIDKMKVLGDEITGTMLYMIVAGISSGFLKANGDPTERMSLKTSIAIQHEMNQVILDVKALGKIPTKE